MGQIQKLPPSLVHKIAAGEVIDRPASVCKELVENSLDAQATQIFIELEEGGKKRIFVKDNGEGILPEDLPLALEPHATSKLQREEDLFSIQSLGFRGEALASIAAVAEVRIASRPPGQPSGFEITNQDNQVRPLGMPEGTFVEVRSLFARTPARRKFLRSNASELRAVVEWFQRIALAYPHVEFHLKEKKELFHLPSTDSLLSRIGDLFGHDLAKELISLDFGDEDYHISGFLAPPHLAKKDRSLQYTYLNGRYIRDKILQGAIRNGLSDLFIKGDHPIYFLFLRISPHLVDVNVHPKKLEVRFVEEQKIYRFVTKALESVYQSLRPVQLPSLSSSFFSPSPSSPSPKFSFSSTVQPKVLNSQGSRKPSAQAKKVSSSSLSPSVLPSSSFMFSSTPYTSFLQIHNSYILLETPQGFRIIDQHALHEKVLFMKMQKALESHVVESQSLLLPFALSLTPEEEILMERLKEPLFQLGFEIVKKEGKWQLCGVPSFLPQRNWEDYFSQVLSDLKEWREVSELKKEHWLATFACRAAIRQGQKLSEGEIQALLEEAEKYSRTYTCAHGRPTYLDFTLEELERLFRRKG